MGKLTISMAIFNSYVKLPECNSGLTPYVDVSYFTIQNLSIISIYLSYTYPLIWGSTSLSYVGEIWGNNMK